jgi:hypothetical protein
MWERIMGRQGQIRDGDRVVVTPAAPRHRGRTGTFRFYGEGPSSHVAVIETEHTKYTYTLIAVDASHIARV